MAGVSLDGMMEEVSLSADITTHSVTTWVTRRDVEICENVQRLESMKERMVLIGITRRYIVVKLKNN